MTDHVAALEVILNSTQEGIIGFDERGQCSFANRSGYAILGYSSDIELQGKEVGQIFTLGDNKKIKNVIRESLYPGHLHTKHQLSLIRKDNVQIPIELWCSAVKEETQDKGFVITFFDISSRVQSEQDLKIKDYAIETSVNAIVFTSLDGIVTYVNKAFLELWGYHAAEDVIGLPASALSGIEGEADTVVAEIIKNGSWFGEVTPKKKNGERFCAQISANLIHDENGEPLFLMSSFVDITNTKDIQAALIRSEETYAKAEAIAHIGSWDWDILTGDLHWTDEIYRIFGQQPRSFGATYEAFLDSIHEDDRQKVIDSVNASVADESVEYHVEHRVVRANTGEIRVVQERGKVYRNDQGEPVRMIGTVYDVTEQREAEKELDAYREKLEDLVEERTRELRRAQDDLVKSERLATLGRLTATVSHELRNPLGAMRPSLYVLKKKMKQKDEKVEQALKRIDRNIDRCDHIIDELLDFTRITTLELQTTDIVSWLDNVINDINIPEEVELIRHYSDKSISMGIDRGRLRRAVINVIDNAYQAALEKINSQNPRVEIDVQERGGEINFIIKDNGIGISEEVKTKMFEPLFSTKGFGVGLGMPTVDQILKQHQGDIRVNSTLGEGTEIYLRVPVSGE